MRIVTWNVNSLNARQDYVGHYLDAESPDVLCIQELKMEEDKIPRDLFEERGYPHLAIHGQKSWNGVLIASKSPLENVAKGLPEVDDGQSRMIAATVGGLRLVNLYCPQGQNVDSPQFPYKLAFFDGLVRWLGEHCDPSQDLLVVGDLNVAPAARDVWSEEALAGVPSYHPKEHARWARLLDFGLEDVVEPRVEAGTFSFWDYRGGAFRFNQGMRIDHILATRSAADRVVEAAIERPWRKKVEGLTASDHAPVSVTLD
ncbi:MAG: exodeoxyribonuclease III [Acidobacteriota bacterium]